MEKRQASTKPTGACEKIYKAVAEHCPLRSMHHRLSLRSQQTPISGAVVSPNHPGGRTTDSPSKSHFFLRKQVATHKPRPGEVDIPIQTGPSIGAKEKEKTANPSLSQPTKQARVTGISESEKVKASLASGNAHLSKVSPKIEAKRPVISVLEKPKQKLNEIPPSNMILVQRPGQGINAVATPRVEPAAKPNNIPLQGLHPKPKSQPATSVVKVTAKQDEPTNYTQGKEDKKKAESGGAHDHHTHTYSAYIEYVKNQLRTKSNVGEETTTARPPSRTPTRRDSFNDRVSNFIARARKNIKTTHHGD